MTEFFGHRRPGSQLLSIPIIVALLAMLFNDRVLKNSGKLPLLSGKLSDMAGLFVLPVIAISTLELIFRRLFGTTWVLLIAILTGIAFSGTKLSGTASSLIGSWWGYVLIPLRLINGSACCTPVTFVQDRTDLLALFVLPVSVLYWRTSQFK